MTAEPSRSAWWIPKKLAATEPFERERCCSGTIKDLSKWSRAKEKSESWFSRVSLYSIIKLTFRGRLWLDTWKRRGRKDDQGTRGLKKSLSITVKFSWKRNMYLFFSLLLEFYFTGEDLNSNSWILGLLKKITNLKDEYVLQHGREYTGQHMPVIIQQTVNPERIHKVLTISHLLGHEGLPLFYLSGPWMHLTNGCFKTNV